MLLNFISYKLEREGGKFVQVARFFPSSKLCSCCGHQHDVLNLSIGEWTCPSCQPTHDRDENAARHLRAEGIKNTGNKLRFRPEVFNPQGQKEAAERVSSQPLLS
jgi:transposase